ncbi:hypothetical protein Bca52824_058752 [Brassica carinata]|uniref:Ribulose bisphosphate carboxylase large chain n=1 Tax=Brassica carinata TaxID=52824 RepID=A0A8X7UEW1_BRACI|nr:hypothetical protein Bca52824_058752 [Brassica carinata]
MPFQDPSEAGREEVNPNRWSFMPSSPSLAMHSSNSSTRVPPEEAGAAVAAESSIGTWTTVWTDGLTSLDRYKGRCYHIEPVPGEENQFIAYVAYPLDLFEEESGTKELVALLGVKDIRNGASREADRRERKSSAKYKANKNAQDLAEGNQCASSHLCYLAERIELVIASGI